MKSKKYLLLRLSLFLLCSCVKKEEKTNEKRSSDEFGVAYSSDVLDKENVFPFSYSDQKREITIATKEEPIQNRKDPTGFSFRIWIGMDLPLELMSEYAFYSPRLCHYQYNPGYPSSFYVDQELPSFFAFDYIPSRLDFPSSNTYYLRFDYYVDIHLNMNEITDKFGNGEYEIAYTIRLLNKKTNRIADIENDSFSSNYLTIVFFHYKAVNQYYVKYQ